MARAWLKGRPRLRGALRLLLIGLVLWLVLAGAGVPGPVGIASIVLALWAGLAFGSLNMYPWRPWQLLAFVVHFLRGSLLGGVDVALRALRPGIHIDPCFIEYPLQIPPGQPRTLLVTAISLMPGTLTAEVRKDSLLVHLLSPHMSAEIEALEYRVAQLFRLDEAERISPA